MIATPWDSIDADTLRALCNEGAAESQTLDFKQVPPAIQRDDARNEFAKDVCAFANAMGGDLVYGIAERMGAAHVLAPLTAETFDACKRRLSQVLANHVEPRIAGVQFKEVPVEGEGYALIVRVPQSFDGPHRFRTRDQGGAAQHRFVTRLETGTTDMDYSQIRAAFGRTAELGEKAQEFRHARIAKLEAHDTLCPMPDGPKSVIHFVPLAGVARGSTVDVAALYRSQINFAPAGGFNPLKETNFEGLLMTSARDPNDRTFRWYIQVFRTGAMEFVRLAGDRELAEDGGHPFIAANRVSDELRLGCQTALARARDLEMTGPAIIGLAYLGVADHPFRIERPGRRYGQGLARHNNLVLAEQWIEEIAVATEVDEFARPLLDSLWQCFGEVECDLYTAAGEWRP